LTREVGGVHCYRGMGRWGGHGGTWDNQRHHTRWWLHVRARGETERETSLVPKNDGYSTHYISLSSVNINHTPVFLKSLLNFRDREGLRILLVVFCLFL
jgi:hypothetical protein